jgi:LysR family transcriptional regulator (chromosome initiation inhibitor)
MSLLDPRLQAFMAIVQSGTVHGASKLLHISQTGVTQRIRALEGQLYTTLFIRSRSGMRMTEEAETLFRYCQGTLDLEGQILGELEGRSKESAVSVTMAGPTSIMSSRIIPGCLHLYNEFPNLLLNYRLDDQINKVDLLKKGVVQLAIISPESVTLEMDSKMLKPDRYLLVASSKWKNRKLSDILQNERIIDFYEDDHTTFSYLKKYNLLEKAKKERLFANTNFAITNLFKAGIGYGTLTAEVAASSIEKGDLIVLNQKQFFEDRQALAWYPRKQMPKYFKAIIESIK